MTTRQKFTFLVAVGLLLGGISSGYILWQLADSGAFSSADVSTNIIPTELSLSPNVAHEREQGLLKQVLVNPHLSELQSGTYVVYRRGNGLYRFRVESETAERIAAVPNWVQNGAIEPETEFYNGNILLNGSFAKNRAPQALQISLSGEVMLGEHVCLTEPDEIVSYTDRICSREATAAGFLDRQPATKDTFAVWTETMGDGQVREPQLIRGTRSPIENRKPQAVSNDGSKLYIASYGEQGGYFGLSVVETGGEERVYEYDNAGDLYSDIQVSPESGYALAYKNHDTFYGQTGDYCHTFPNDAPSKVRLINLITGETQKVLEEEGYVYGLSVSPGGAKWTHSRSDYHPDCSRILESQNNVQHWVTVIGNGETEAAVSIPGTHVDWIDETQLVLYKEKDRSYIVYNLETQEETLINGFDQGAYIDTWIIE